MKFPSRLPIPDEVLRIAKKLEDSGYETWCGGGAIRDYLRILRALRFSARFQFRIHARTLEAAKANAQGLAQLSAERVRDEWFKGIMTAARVSKLLTLWMEVGAARIWLPEIREKGEGRGSISAVDKLPRDPVLITAYLASDPASLLTRLKCSNKDIERGRAIGVWRDEYPAPKHLPAVRKWLSEVGEYADDLLALPPARTAPLSLLPKAVRSVREGKDPLTLKDLAVSGDDLLAAGVRPGPDVGETLQRLLAEVLEDPSRNTKPYLLSRV